MKAKTLHYIPTKPDSIPEQLSQIEDVVVKKPSAIVFIPVDYKAMVPGVEKINDAKIPVVNVTDRSAGGKFVAFVGADDYSLGLETGRYLLKTLGGKGNFVIIEGVKGSLTSIDRVRGFNDALKENPGPSCWRRSRATISGCRRFRSWRISCSRIPEDRRRVGCQRRDGDRRDRGARWCQSQGPGHRRQWHQGGNRRDQGREIAGERRLQWLHAGMLADRIAFAGPLTSDDGQTMIGSLLAIDFPDRAAAERWQADEPFTRAGVYQSASVLPFVNLWPQMAGFPPAA
jgi:uncharacterized protein YciI